uniref:Variant surface glycoprotein 1125.412 n=1 Tax=Trypanosoma brucei TaxID=5691 RepID=A0A1J0R5R8_9TRYP|nr:variant surface glycoprotein 1125.412 [Trypanosoma brucei]
MTTVQNNVAIATYLIIQAMSTASKAAVLTESSKLAKPCDEAAYTNDLAKKFEGKATGINEQLTELGRTELKWRLAAALEANTIKKAAKEALALSARQRAAMAASMARTAQTTLQKAVRILRFRVAAALTAKALTGTSAKTETAATAESGAAGPLTGGAICPVTITNPKQVHGCDLDKINNAAIGTEAAPTTTNNQIKLLPDSFFQIPKILIKAMAKGAGAETHGTINQNHGNKCQDATPTNILAATALFQRENADTPTTQELGSVAGGNLKCSEIPADSEQITGSRTEVAVAICAGLTAVVPAVADITTATGSEVSDLPEMATIGRQLLITPEQLKAMPKGQEAEKVKERIKGIYGTGPTDFKTNYLSALKIKRNYNLGDQSESASIEDIAQKPNAEEILAHFIGLDYRRPKTENENQGSSDKDSEKKTDTGDKTAEKKDVDNKTTTNITGSNSFVIHKAPLWLAVLLL